MNTEAPVTTRSCSTRALTCGANPGSPVTDDYASPFKLARQPATGGAIPRNTPEWSIWTPTAARQSLSHHQRISDPLAPLLRGRLHTAISAVGTQARAFPPIWAAI
jgi:hypothetical protein